MCGIIGFALSYLYLFVFLFNCLAWFPSRVYLYSILHPTPLPQGGDQQHPTAAVTLVLQNLVTYHLTSTYAPTLILLIIGKHLRPYTHSADHR